MLYKYWLVEVCKPIMDKTKCRTFEKIPGIFPSALQSNTNSGAKIICVQKYMIALVICAYPWKHFAGIFFPMWMMSNYILGAYNTVQYCIIMVP